MKKTKEERYEDLVTAVEGGQLSMVKFLWNLVSEIDELVGTTPQGQIEKRAKEVDAILDRLKKNPLKDGKTPTKEELLTLIQPLIPRPIPGAPGRTPTEDELLDLIESVMPEMPEVIPGPPGKPGKKGDRGNTGPMPKHEWKGTFIRFELPDGWAGKRAEQLSVEDFIYLGKLKLCYLIPFATLHF
jgi:hypothetical protein